MPSKALNLIRWGSSFKDPRKRNTYLVLLIVVVFILLVFDVLFVLSMLETREGGRATEHLRRKNNGPKLLRWNAKSDQTAQLGYDLLQESFRNVDNLTGEFTVGGDVEDLFGVRVGLQTGPDCPAKCSFVQGEDFSVSDVLLLNFRKPLPCSKDNNQIWIGFTQRVTWNPKMTDKTIMDQIDFLAGPSLDADFPLLNNWLPVSEAGILYSTSEPFTEKMKQPLLAGRLCPSAVGSENKEAVRLFNELERLGVSSRNYGSCDPKNGAKLTALKKQYPNKQEDDLMNSLFGMHLFAFVAEMEDCDFHHGRPIMLALESGSVPVYVGSQTIKRYIPPKSVIVASDFASVQALADYLLELSEDKTLYNDYLQWRFLENPGELGKLTQLRKYNARSKIDFLCDICKAAAMRSRNPRKSVTVAPPSCESQRLLLDSYVNDKAANKCRKTRSKV